MGCETRIPFAKTLRPCSMDGLRTSGANSFLPIERAPNLHPSIERLSAAAGSRRMEIGLGPTSGLRDSAEVRTLSGEWSCATIVDDLGGSLSAGPSRHRERSGSAAASDVFTDKRLPVARPGTDDSI